MQNLWYIGITFLLQLNCLSESMAVTLEVGPGKPYTTPAQAAAFAQPGDTILIFPHIYGGGNYIANLHGNTSAYIYFIGVDVNTVIFQGGGQAFHFSDVSYIHFENISITLQTANGMNIDDGGSFDTPAHHFRIKGCKFYNMGAQGNNDLLKMSGVDSFWIYNCIFLNGAGGGSGLDMVGCHHGWIFNNNFENMGSNAIQAKGGTQFIDIHTNYFKNCGQRTLNLGGSTGLQFFRPQNAPFEAADLNVFANVFIGSTAPIAYVGCVRTEVFNNTIINPGNWIIRILQETVDPDRFLPCGDNSFKNNIIWYGNISTHVNIGPNTAPNTFVFSHNLWFRHTNPSNSVPNLPAAETSQIAGQNPLFNNISSENFRLTGLSPAINSGTSVTAHSDRDQIIRPVGNNFERGAYEYLPPAQIDYIDGNSQVCLNNPVQKYKCNGLNILSLIWTVSGGQVIQTDYPNNEITVQWSTDNSLKQITAQAANLYHPSPVSQTMDVTLIETGQIFKNNQSTDWNSRSGWTPFALPQSCHHVFIPGNPGLDPIIISEGTQVQIKSLYIGSGITLMFSANTQLIIKPE